MFVSIKVMSIELKEPAGPTAGSGVVTGRADVTVIITPSGRTLVGANPSREIRLLLNDVGYSDLGEIPLQVQELLVQFGQDIKDAASLLKV